MDFVPFTIFFMVCHLCFHGNLAAAVDCGVTRDVPEECLNKNYCTIRPTTGYPNTNQLLEMVKYSGFNISTLPTTTPKPDPTDRSSNPCKEYFERDLIYMVKDANNVNRYVVQDSHPKLVKQQIDLRKCKEDELQPCDVKCEQNFTSAELLVTTCDGKGVELIKFTYHAGCFLSTK